MPNSKRRKGSPAARTGKRRRTPAETMALAVKQDPALLVQADEYNRRKALLRQLEEGRA